jgi:phage shock protein E
MALNAKESLMNTKHIFPVIALMGLGAFMLASARAESGAKEAMAAGATLIDVRTPAEFAEGHLQGAVNIPVDALQGRISEVGAKAKPVVVYCRSGKRSARAKGMLKDAGYETVFDLGAMSNGN